MNSNSPYTEWQEKWQSSEASSVPPLTEELFSRLEEEDRRTARINRIKTIALAAIFLVMGLQLYAFPLPQKSWTLPLGLIWVAANTLIYFRSVLKRQFSIRKLDLGLPSLQFVRQAMVKVQEEFLYVRRSLPGFVAIQTAASNLIFIGFWPKHTMWQLLIAHGVLTGMIFLSAALGFWARRRIYIRSAQPLLEELRQTERSWSRSEKES